MTPSHDGGRSNTNFLGVLAAVAAGCFQDRRTRQHEARQGQSEKDSAEARAVGESLARVRAEREDLAIGTLLAGMDRALRASASPARRALQIVINACGTGTSLGSGAEQQLLCRLADTIWDHIESGEVVPTEIDPEPSVQR